MHKVTQRCNVSLNIIKRQSSQKDFWATGPQANFTSQLYSLLGNFTSPAKILVASGVRLVSFRDWKESLMNT